MNQQIPLRIGLGTAAIGRPHYINIRQANADSFSLKEFRQKGKHILDLAYQNGIRYFDTAPGYGLAEQLLMDWVLKKKDTDIEIATKWGYTYTANFSPNAIQHEVKEHSLSKLNEQWKVSKKLLPHLTTYQIHSATFETGILENVDVLRQLAELKKLHRLKIGISTTGANQLEVLQKALEVNISGEVLFDVFQITYNILDQSLTSISQNPLAQNKRFIIKEALANGRLFPNKKYPHYKNLYHFIQQLAMKYKVGVDAIALRFCIDSIDSFMVLSGASEEEHLLQNLQVTSFQLTKDEIELLKQFATVPKEYWNERKLLAWN